MKHKFIVSGTHKGQEIDEEVEAYTQKQAKAKAGFSNGFGGSGMTPFMGDKSIKVRRVK